MQLFNMSLRLGSILKGRNKWIIGARDPWKPYSCYINHMLNTYNPIVSFLREQHEKFEQPILHFAFHSDTPQGVALELVNEGVIDLRYVPDVKHMKYPGLAVMKGGKPKWAMFFHMSMLKEYLLVWWYLFEVKIIILALRKELLINLNLSRQAILKLICLKL